MSQSPSSAGQQPVYALALAHVRHERHALIAARAGEAELREAAQQREGQVVHAVVVHVLEYVRRLALARAGHPGNDKKLHLFSRMRPRRPSLCYYLYLRLELDAEARRTRGGASRA